jgi:FlaA1/EpsC-like NDP-sugar epimerase
MTIPEACQLVIQAGALGKGGEVLILDMGEAVKILEVARRMIAMSGKDVDIVYTGLRPGEKLHEQLVGDGESDARPLHPKISHTRAEALNPERLDLAYWLAKCTGEDGCMLAVADEEADEISQPRRAAS